MHANSPGTGAAGAPARAELAQQARNVSLLLNRRRDSKEVCKAEALKPPTKLTTCGPRSALRARELQAAHADGLMDGLSSIPMPHAKALGLSINQRIVGTVYCSFQASLTHCARPCVHHMQLPVQHCLLLALGLL